MDVQTTATAVEKGIEGFMKIEPTIVTVASMFVPGAAPIMAMIQPEILIAIPFVEQALRSIAAGQNMNGASAIFELIKHLMPGEANAMALSPSVSSDDPAANAGSTSSG